MIQRDKNIQARQNIQKIIIRAGQLKQTIKCMYQYILFTQQSYQSYCRNVFQNLLLFQNKISKNCKYQPDKTNMVLRLSKQYRQLPSKIQNNSEINLNKLPNLSKNQQLNKWELQLNKKAQTFRVQFSNYSDTIFQYNSIYQQYLNNCKHLDQIISKFKSYSDPLKFYDKSITSEYQQKLQSSLNLSKNDETKVTTQLQLLDSKRKFLDQLIKQLREIFTHLFHNCLKNIQTLTYTISDPAKDNHVSHGGDPNKYIQSVHQSQKHSQAYDVEFQRLNTFTSIIDEGNQIMSDFNDIFKDKRGKRFNQQIVADHKLFSMRCQNIKKKKQRSFNQCLNLHEAFLGAFQQQIKNYKQFEKSFKQKQKKIFGFKGKESHKKDFLLFFGAHAYQLYEFVLVIIETPRNVFEQINVWLTDNYVNFKQVVISKKQSITRFNNFYNQIMDQHLKQKAKFQNSDHNYTQISQSYRANLVSSFDQFKTIFSQLQARENQKDKIISQKLTLLYKFITKQYNLCMIQNISQKHKDKLQILKHFKIISQAMVVFKNDSIYNILYQQFFGLNLQKTFESKINKKQYSQAQAILKQKQKIAKKMLKRQIGCCGLIKASPIDSQIFSTHKCYIYNHLKNCPYGKLKILKDGLIFSQTKWNPFADKVYILVPKSDIQSIQPKTLSNSQNCQQVNEGVALNTQKGQLIFFSKQYDELYTALQNNYGQSYRKSLAIDRKGLTKNDSTQSGGQNNRTSVLVSYNKDQKIFVEQPVCLNPALTKMNLSGSGQLDKKLKGSAVYRSNISLNSDDNRLGKSSKIKSKSQLKQEQTIRSMYQQLILHYDKHQFLPDKFTFINKSYKSSQRKDYQYNDKDNHNHFVLKQSKMHHIIDSTAGILLQINYQWKIAYPSSPYLHSFKHGQKIHINLNSNPPLIQIIEWPHVKNQIFNRHIFYQNIKIMNDRIWKYIVQNTNQDFLYQPVIQKQYDPADNSQQMIVDDIKQFGRSYPEQLMMKQSKINPFSNDLKVPGSGQFIDFRASNAKSTYSIKQSKSLVRSQIRQSGQGLFKAQI